MEAITRERKVEAIIAAEGNSELFRDLPSRWASLFSCRSDKADRERETLSKETERQEGPKHGHCIGRGSSVIG